METEKKWSNFWRVASVVALALSALATTLAGISLTSPVEVDEPVARSSYQTACYQVQGGASWVAGSGCSWSVESGATLSVDSALNLDDTDSTLAGAQTLTPTATYYQMAPATVLTLTLATGSANDGDLLIIHNTVATNTTIVDTGATVGGGNITLAVNDLAMFIYGNSKWIEIASPDNS